MDDQEPERFPFLTKDEVVWYGALIVMAAIVLVVGLRAQT